MTNPSYDVILIGGFGLSGSSAVEDLLREFDTVRGLGIELRLIVDPDGIMSLENALAHAWSPYQSDLAIKRFRRLVRKLGNPFTWPYFTLDHTRTFGKSFNTISDQYCKDLTSCTYQGKWYGINNPLIFLGRKINKQLEKTLFRFFKPIHIADTRDRFLPVTQKYLDHLIRTCIKDPAVRHVLVNEPFAALNPSKVFRYFNSARMIVVHRDPRDVFVNARHRRYFVPQEVETFIPWYRAIQEQTLREADHPQVLRVAFEDLVLHYEETLAKIARFLSLDPARHTARGQFFNPQTARAKVGFWKNVAYRQEVDQIAKELGEHCYDDEPIKKGING